MHRQGTRTPRAMQVPNKGTVHPLFPARNHLVSF